MNQEIQRTIMEPELLQIFLTDLNNCLSEGREVLLGMDQENPSELEFKELYRPVHTIKGSLAMADWDELAKLVHVYEDAISQCRDNGKVPPSDFADLGLDLLDLVEQIVVESNSEASTASLEARLQKLQPEKWQTKTSEAQDNPSTDTDASKDHMVPVDSRELQSLLNELSVLYKEEVASGNAQTAQKIEAILAKTANAGRGALKPLVLSLKNTVRQVAAKLEKDVEFVVEGEKMRIEFPILQALQAVLPHMVRNSLDHGIEELQDRLLAQKEMTAKLDLKFRTIGSMLSVVLEDDGKGMDANAIASKALEKGIVTEDALKTMTMQDKLALIFEAGFSTASQVTSVSGRGVGMDVVRSSVESLGGEIILESQPGQGTLIEILIPQSYRQESLLILDAAGTKVGVPARVIQTLIEDKEGLIPADGALMRGESYYPWIGLNTLDPRFGKEVVRNFAVLSLQGLELAFAFDRILGSKNATIEPITQKSIPPIFSGSCYWSDQDIVWCLDSDILANSWNEYMVPMDL